MLAFMFWAYYFIGYAVPGYLYMLPVFPHFFMNVQLRIIYLYSWFSLIGSETLSKKYQTLRINLMKGSVHQSTKLLRYYSLTSNHFCCFVPKIDMRRLTQIFFTSLYSKLLNITYGNKVRSCYVCSNRWWDTIF